MTAPEPTSHLPLLRAKRLSPGDTVALINPSNAIFEREPYRSATESLQALGFTVREAPNLRARWGPYGGTDAQRAADVNAMFADTSVHGILALTGGSGGTRMLPRVDFDLIGRNPKFLGGYSDLTALINAVHARTGLVTFHSPLGLSEWNSFSVDALRAMVMDAQVSTLCNLPEKTELLVNTAGRTTALRGGRASGPLVGGNLSVMAAMAGSNYWPSFDGAILALEDVNEAIYRVDRMLSTLRNAGVFERLAGVVLGGFTNCTSGEGGYSSFTLDDVFDDYFLRLGVPVFSGAAFGHIKRKYTLPIGLPVEIDADAGSLRLLQSAVI